ncbi:EAL domain-containing protein [Nocardioides litoris]|uniref:EAL domain-containing protein n=1 Tax=Nocardioides litoris TaxID=1926648 RepID=UPI00111E2F54|nr:EAL domain-containing protein [Nocardioides litoris]
MSSPSPASLAIGLDQHGATLPTTSTLISTIADLRAGHSDSRNALVLLAASLGNAAEIADVHGAHALEMVTAEVARRALQFDDLRVRLLRASPLGGFLAAVVVERDHVQARVDDLLTGLRRLVSLSHDLVWPVVTVGAAVCDSDDEVWAVVRDVRAAVVAAGRESPGATRWHVEAAALGVTDELTRVRDLAEAITVDPQQLDLHFQPVHDLAGGHVVGAEALLRWTHPLRGAVSPVLTVEAAERTGLIVPLGRLVLGRALAQAAAWRDQVRPGFRMHVNVSPLELREPSYVDHVEAALARSGVAPSSLLLEITETAALTDEPAARETLLALRRLGVGIGIDDFGTGYSTIAHLHRLPIDTVKIDRSLISGVAREASGFELVRSVLDLVSTLGVTIVAEGIETAVEAAHLRSMGCQQGQGYHLGRPVPAAEFLGCPTVRSA